jgi:hypothetical protein
MTRPCPVSLRDRATSRYLSPGAEWSLDAARAIVLERDDALALLRRFACEPEAIDLVDAAERAVA